MKNNSLEERADLPSISSSFLRLNWLPLILRRHRVVRLWISLFPSARVQEIRFNGTGRLIGDVADPNLRNVFLRRSFEPDYFTVANSFLHRGGVMIDAGANFGFCSFGMLAICPEVEVHLFEANAGICQYLRRSAAIHSYARITINHACVSDQPGISRLMVNPADLGQSYISEAGQCEVKNLMLDDYILERGIACVQFLKMDIEGHEIHALRGAARSLAAGTFEAIYLEVSEPNLSRKGLTPADCFSLLCANDYHLYLCRAADLALAIRLGLPLTDLAIRGRIIRVAPIKAPQLPAGFHGDVLAVHSKLLSPHFSH